MAHRFDATLKDIVAQHPADFAAAFGLPANEPPTALNVDLSTVSAATDVALGFGKPIREIVDLNFQSGPDPRLPARLHVYNAVLNLRYGVPVRTLLVLLRPKADSANITGHFRYETGPEGVEFRYKVVRLWEEPRATFLEGGVGLVPLALLCDIEDEDLVYSLREVVRLIDTRLQKETEPAEAVRLMTATYVLAGLRVNEDELSTIFAGVTTMPESTAFDAMIERGQIRQNHLVLLRLGRIQFGGSPDLETESELLAIRDLDRLNRMIEAVLTAESWQELLATP